MRPCTSCTSQGLLYVLSPRDERCEQCYRFRRQCDLASPWAEDDRLGRKEKELQAQEERLLDQAMKAREQALEAERKAVRLRKQTRLL
jgi:hypothetical protein